MKQSEMRAVAGGRARGLRWMKTENTHKTFRKEFCCDLVKHADTPAATVHI